MKRPFKLSTVGWTLLATLLLMIPAGMGAWRMHVTKKLAHADRTYDYGLLYTNGVWHFTCRYDCPHQTNVLTVFRLFKPTEETGHTVSYGAENASLYLKHMTLWSTGNRTITSLSEEELDAIRVCYYYTDVDYLQAWQWMIKEAGLSGDVLADSVGRFVFFIERDHSALTSSVARYQAELPKE